jgi:hypothetical protein
MNMTTTFTQVSAVNQPPGRHTSHRLSGAFAGRITPVSYQAYQHNQNFNGTKIHRPSNA